MTRRHLMLIALLLAPIAVRADAPPLPPNRQVVCSASGSICAESDPRSNVTKVVHRASGRELWSIAGWHRWMFVAEDGQSLAIGYAGMNLVPLDAELSLEVMRFYAKGRLVRTLRLADLYQSRSQLRRTASHIAWVQSVGVNRANQLVLELVTGRKVAFAMSTGQEQALARDGG
jgi:hypothetical protein